MGIERRSKIEMRDDDPVVCSEGCKFTRATAPDKCEHGIGIHGGLLRAAARVFNMPKLPPKKPEEKQRDA